MQDVIEFEESMLFAWFRAEFTNLSNGGDGRIQVLRRSVTVLVSHVVRTPGGDGIHHTDPIQGEK